MENIQSETISTITASKKSIKDWAEDERPREKMIRKGTGSLSDAELLAILIRNGAKDKSAVDLARDILSRVKNNLNLLARSTLKEFQQTKGIGMAKAVVIAAALELGRRRQTYEGLKKEKIVSSRDAADILTPLMQDKTHEVFCVMYLNHARSLMHYEFISSGGISGTVVDIKMILKNALQTLASSIIVAHNHPSGNQYPSQSDKLLTQKLKNAAQMIDIKLCDHIIIADDRYFSFLDKGLL
jgi:DNA repair protein RadC